jgi:hypothetical protein
MMKSQELGLSFEEAIEDVGGEDFAAYEAWVRGLAAAGAAGAR